MEWGQIHSNFIGWNDLLIWILQISDNATLCFRCNSTIHCYAFLFPERRGQVDIARITGVTEGAISNILKRARQAKSNQINQINVYVPWSQGGHLGLYWGFILVRVWRVVVWVLWFLVVGLFLMVVGLGVGCLVVGWVGWWLFFYGCFPWCFFCVGVGGCWLFVGFPRFLQPFSSASRGPPWSCLWWLLGVWFVWFSRTSPGRVLVFRLLFHIVCIGGLGICFCSWLWRPAFWFWLWV